MGIYGILFSYTGCVGYESIDERMVLVIPKGAVAKDPRPAPGSVLPKDATDLKVKFLIEFGQKIRFLITKFLFSGYQRISMFNGFTFRQFFRL